MPFPDDPTTLAQYQILDYLAHYDTDVGETVSTHELLDELSRLYAIGELLAALSIMNEEGWIETVRAGSSVQLTQIGRGMVMEV